jgi:hypothetical protein
MDKITKLLKGAVDLHVHSGPGLIPRSLDHAEAVKQARGGERPALHDQWVGLLP